MRERPRYGQLKMKNSAIITDKYYEGLLFHLINEGYIKFDRESETTFEYHPFRPRSYFAIDPESHFLDFEKIIKKNRFKRRSLQMAFIHEKIILSETFGYKPEFVFDNLERFNIEYSRGMDLTGPFDTLKLYLDNCLNNIKLIGDSLYTYTKLKRNYSTPYNSTLVEYFDKLYNESQKRFKFSRKDYFSFLVKHHLYNVYLNFKKTNIWDYDYLDYEINEETENKKYKEMKISLYFFPEPSPFEGVWEQFIIQLDRYLKRQLYFMELSINDDFNILQNDLSFSKFPASNDLNSINREKALNLIKVELLNFGYNFPVFDSFTEMIKIKEKKLKEIRRFNSILSMIEKDLLIGESQYIKSAKREITLALKDLNKGLRVKKINSICTYLSLPVAITEMLLFLPPVFGITGSIVGTATEVASNRLNDKSSWLYLFYKK